MNQPHIYKQIAFFLAICLLNGCNLDNRVKNTKALTDEMQNSKIKRITNEQINTIVDEWGERIAQKAQRELTDAITKKPSEAANYCALQNIPNIDSLSKMYGVKISLLTTNDIKNTKLSPKEREVLDAYIYSIENKLPMDSNIQKLGDSMFVYNAPVPVQNLICEHCAASKQSPLVVWNIQFLRREIIKRVDGKALLKMK